jgi:hypothetical protein
MNSWLSCIFYSNTNQPPGSSSGNTTIECERWQVNSTEKAATITETGSFQAVIYQFRISQIQSMTDAHMLKSQILSS